MGFCKLHFQKQEGIHAVRPFEILADNHRRIEFLKGWVKFAHGIESLAYAGTHVFWGNHPAADVVVTVTFSPQLDKAFILYPFHDRHVVGDVFRIEVSDSGTLTDNVQLFQCIRRFTESCITFGQVQVQFGHTNQWSRLVLLFFGTGSPGERRLNELLRQVTGHTVIAVEQGRIVAVKFRIAHFQFQGLSTIDTASHVAAIECNPSIEAGLTASVQIDDVLTA